MLLHTFGPGWLDTYEQPHVPGSVTGLEQLCGHGLCAVWAAGAVGSQHLVQSQQQDWQPEPSWH